MVVVLGMADNVKVTVDLSEFTKALKDYTAVSRLTVSEAVNKKARDFCFNAAEHTDVARDYSDSLTIGHTSFKLFHALAAARQGGKGSASFQRAAEKAQDRIKKKLGAGPFVKGNQNEKAAKAIAGLRRRAKRYSQALWYKLIQQLSEQTTQAMGGKRGPAKKNKIKNTSARAAVQSKAFDRPKAHLVIEGVEDKHAKEVLNYAAVMGMRETIADMREYINAKLSDLAVSFSGRKKRSRATPGATRGRRKGARDKRPRAK